MRPLAVSLAVLAVALFCSTVSAQGFYDSAGNNALKGAISGNQYVAPDFRLVDGTGTPGGTLTKSVSWGTRIRYAGNLGLKLTSGVGIALLAYEAGTWFYDVLQGETGTDLDTWGDGEASISTDEAGRWFYDTEPGQMHRCWYGPPYSFSFVALPDQVSMSDCVAAALAAVEAVYNVNAHDSFNDPSHEDYQHSNQYSGYIRYEVFPEVSMTRDDLGTFLQANPSAQGPLLQNVVPQYLDDLQSQGRFPYTYQNPVTPTDGDVSLSPTPNDNQWWDNPYADPSEDTDGDGWKDWEEDVAGTDPNDPASQPSVSPDPNPGTEPDADGDTVPDEHDPCPYDAANICALDVSDLALEATQAEMLAEMLAQGATLEQIRDALSEDTWVDPAYPADPVVDVSTLENPDITFDATAFDSLETTLQGAFDTLVAEASGKAPFAYAAWIDDQDNTLVPTDECPQWSVTLGGTTQPVSMCGNAAEDWMRVTGRPILVVLLWLAFAWTVVTIGLRS